MLPVGTGLEALRGQCRTGSSDTKAKFVLVLEDRVGADLLGQVIDFCFFFSSRRRHTRFSRDWSSDVCSSDLASAQKQPWALRYSGQIPVCSTNVPRAGSEYTSFLRRVLHRASTTSGASPRMNATTSALFGSCVTKTGVRGSSGG